MFVVSQIAMSSSTARKSVQRLRSAPQARSGGLAHILPQICRRMRRRSSPADGWPPSQSRGAASIHFRTPLRSEHVFIARSCATRSGSVHGKWAAATACKCMQGRDMMDPPAHVQGSPRGGSSALAPYTLELGAVCTHWSPIALHVRADLSLFSSFPFLFSSFDGWPTRGGQPGLVLG